MDWKKLFKLSSGPKLAQTHELTYLHTYTRYYKNVVAATLYNCTVCNTARESAWDAQHGRIVCRRYREHNVQSARLSQLEDLFIFRSRICSYCSYPSLAVSLVHRNGAILIFFILKEGTYSHCARNRPLCVALFKWGTRFFKEFSPLKVSYHT